jgi:hypothetical protein
MGLIAMMVSAGCDDGAAPSPPTQDAGSSLADASSCGSTSPRANDSGLARGDAACAVPVECAYPDTSGAHVTGEVDYRDRPPAGGTHNQCWGPWGVHQSELPDERWVHNLEHGGVVYLYRCDDGCPSEVATMSNFVTGRRQALLTPYAALPTRFAVVAWGVRMVSDCFDQAAFEAFYSAHVNRGPEQIADDPPTVCR